MVENQPDPIPGPDDAARIRREAEARVQEHLDLWPRITRATGYLIPRRVENGFALSIRQSMETPRR